MTLSSGAEPRFAAESRDLGVYRRHQDYGRAKE